MITFDEASSTLTYSSWDEFRKYIARSFFSTAYFYTDDGVTYTVVTQEIGGIKRKVVIQKDNGPDQIDFEQNFKDQAAQSSVPFQGDMSSTQTIVSASIVSVILLSESFHRAQAIVYNDSPSDLYVMFGQASTSSDYTYFLWPYSTLELPLPVYSGVVSGIWTLATGSARINELRY